MRLKGLLLGDMQFQMKYGFYFLYVFMTVVYIIVLSLMPPTVKGTVAAIIIFTDPAALGLVFMGAIVLLEKSQRVLPSLAVSPAKPCEYICSKAVSLGLISTLAGVITGIAGGTHHLFWTAAGTFLGAVLFSLLGLILAAKADSLNQFLILIVPTMIVLMLPPLADVFGYSHTLFLFHPGNAVLRLISGNTENLPATLSVFAAWLVVFYCLSAQSAQKMLNRVGGVKL